ncbi:MAG: WecB/TagA/CpsF family glycosyltransferase [Parachlamydiaceae bacterium]
MNNLKSCLLGISVDHLSREDLVKHYTELFDHYQSSHQPKYVASVNNLFFSHLHGWALNTPHHKELLRIIRNADLVVVGSSFLCHLSLLLGSPIQEPIPSEELFQSACEWLSEINGSLYVLGGHEQTNQSTYSHIRTYYPNVHFVGSSSPLILTKGNRIDESQERDDLIIEQINEAQPTVLLLQLGHPKQEVWFERIRAKLKVPLVIGIGGGIERYLALDHTLLFWEEFPHHKAKPTKWKAWTQAFRYFPDHLKYGFWLPPLLLYNTISRVMGAIHHPRKKEPIKRYLFLSSQKSLVVIPFPVTVDKEDQQEIYHFVEESIEQDYLVLDLSRLKHIDPHGIGLIMRIRKWAEVLGKKMFILNIPKDIRLLFQLQGVWNYFDILEARDAKDIIYNLTDVGKGPLSNLEFYQSVYQNKNEVILSFFGDFILVESQQQLLHKLIPILAQKNCTIDLTYCTFVDNRSIGFLLKLRHFQEQHGRLLKISGVNSTISNQFKLARVKFETALA